MKAAIPWSLCIALAWVAIQGQCAQRELDAANKALAELRTDELQARTEAQGWRTQLVQATSELEGELQNERTRGALLEEEKAALAREVEALGARLTVMADLYADARGQIVARAEVHQDSSSDKWTSKSVPDSITAPIDDGLISGRIAYFPLPREFDLTYRAQLGLTIAVSEAPDGRGLVTVMPEDPRVSLSYGEVLYQRPEPVRICSLGQRGRHWLEGAAVSELLQLVFSTLTP